jgi:hypothetical protein
MGWPLVQTSPTVCLWLRNLKWEGQGPTWAVEPLDGWIRAYAFTSLITAIQGNICNLSSSQTKGRKLYKQRWLLQFAGLYFSELPQQTITRKQACRSAKPMYRGSLSSLPQHKPVYEHYVAHCPLSGIYLIYTAFRELVLLPKRRVYQYTQAVYNVQNGVPITNQPLPQTFIESSGQIRFHKEKT